MSSLIVEVCRVQDIQPHPQADRLAVATVKGWKTCVRSANGKPEFEVDEKCIYFPPDSVLPLSLANKPTDTPPGRLGIMNFLNVVKDEEGNIVGGRVKSARLRGQRSEGFIMKIDPALGDNPDWEVGTDVKEFYGVKKWEPPMTATDGDAEAPHPRFHKYTDIERIQNFPGVIADGEEVVFTEKLHGKNCRLGLVLDTDDTGNAVWTWMAGSHDVRRKEFSGVYKSFDAVELLGVPRVAVGDTFGSNSAFSWKVVEVRENNREGEFRFRAQQMENDQPVLNRTEMWHFLDDKVKELLKFVVHSLPWPEQKSGVILFGEVFGQGVQDLAYGQTGKSFRAFDIAVNHKYLDYDVKEALCRQFDVPMVPVLYRGPFSQEVLDQHTSGPTTMCQPDKAGKFKGREGIVITPVVERNNDERMNLSSTNGRVILKSISVDYEDRKGGTDGH
jgi:hypothetical protein